MSSPAFEVTACVLVRRRDTDVARWLLSVRPDDNAYAAGRIGLIGGHVERADGPADALEHAARREAAEEAGIDLIGVRLLYLASLQYAGAGGVASIDVTFAADAPAASSVRLAAPDELSEVGWWSAAELAADPRCPDWLPDLVRAADDRLRAVSAPREPAPPRL